MTEIKDNQQPYEIMYTVRLENMNKRQVLWLVRGDYKNQIGHINAKAGEKLKFLNPKSVTLFDKDDIKAIEKEAADIAAKPFARRDIGTVSLHVVKRLQHILKAGEGTLDLTVDPEENQRTPPFYQDIRVDVLLHDAPLASWSNLTGIKFEKGAPSLFVKDKIWIAYECVNCLTEQGKGIFA